MSGSLLLLQCISIFLLMVGGVYAAPLRDERTGVLIDLPPRWGMRKQVYSWGGESYLLYREPIEGLDQPDCWATIFGPPHYATTGQGYIETFRDPTYLDEFKREWGGEHNLVSAARFIRGSIIGVMVIGDEKAKHRRRIMNARLTSPTTSVIFACYAGQTQFKRLQPEYDAIMHGMTFPE